MNMSKIDAPCHALVQALNLVKGIETSESCCGHGEDEFHIWFDADNLECLPNVLYWFDGCHCGFYDWRVEAKTDCGKSPVFFMVSGPQGSAGYLQADTIAGLITKDVQGG